LTAKLISAECVTHQQCEMNGVHYDRYKYIRSTCPYYTE